MTPRVPWFTIAVLGLIAASNSAPTLAQDWNYTARPGDTLWSISDVYLRRPSDWPALQQHNRISDPKKIAPGTQIRIPLALLKQKPDPVVVSFVHGSAWLRRGKGSEPAAPLSLGNRLQVGDRISTDRDASVTLTFADGSIVTLSQQSELELDTISTHRSNGMVDTRLRLQRGQIQSQVRPRSKPGARFEIITPAAVAAARGTQFRVTSMEAPASSRSEVSEGTIGVSAQGVERAVSVGYGVITTKGEVPGEPRMLPRAPNLTRIPNSLTPGERASWEPLVGAAAYRVMILDADASEARIFDQTQSEPTLVWPSLKPGQYLVRIHANDLDGFEGLDSEQRVTGLALPPAANLVAPAPISPTESTRTSSQQITFHWRAVTGANSYRVQIRANDAPTPVLDAQSATLHLMAPVALPPGNYAWRVAARNAAGKQSDYSGETHFAITTAPPH